MRSSHLLVPFLYFHQPPDENCSSARPNFQTFTTPLMNFSSSCLKYFKLDYFYTFWVQYLNKNLEPHPIYVLKSSGLLLPLFRFGSSPYSLCVISFKNKCFTYLLLQQARNNPWRGPPDESLPWHQLLGLVLSGTAVLD